MKSYRLRPAGQRGVRGPTAQGYTVPVDAIPHLRRISIKPERFDGFSEDLSTSEKGSRAVDIVAQLLKGGAFPLWVEGALVNDVAMQIDGDDIHVRGQWRIQVKCDFRGGDKALGGTGNLYLQIAERNPLRLI